MKLRYIFLTLAAALIAGCSDDLDKGGAYNPEKGVIATIPSYSFDDGTRVNISDDLQTFTWSDGDRIGIYCTEDDVDAAALFTINQGGSSAGSFGNDMFYLNSSKTYYACYPFNSEACITSMPVDFTGQVQNGNGSAAHLGAYNYMFAPVTVNDTGSARVNFKNLGSVVQLRLTVSNAATYTGIDITSNGTKFITKGKANMANGNITATETSASIHLDFESGITLNEGDVLTANILAAPVDMSGSTLTITLTDADNNEFEETTAGKNMLQGKAYLYETTFIPYVTFTADAEQTFVMSKSVSTLEYSVNGGDWAELGTNQVTFGGANGNLRLRGKASMGTNGAIISFGNPTKVACCGDIRTLMDYENYKSPKPGLLKCNFPNLFEDCFQLTSAPILPLTTLKQASYYYMFKGCTSLTKAPELPAMTLAAFCYDGMFSGCTSLTSAPELPATTLAGCCYSSMFKGCTSLISAPELPATTLEESCYFSMFDGCTSLISAPELPAMVLTKGCYQYMFQGCTSLTSAPELPATTLAAECYQNMFYLCTSLTQVPQLPATILKSSCYSSMFQFCSSLTQTPELQATTLAESCYNSMFYGCRSLTQAPELPATTLAEGCYERMFQHCSSLTQAPELPATTLAKNCYYVMFGNCTNLNYIKMMAIDISAFNCLDLWVYGVPSTGTFVKNSAATWDVTGDSGIPSGWTVETASE